VGAITTMMRENLGELEAMGELLLGRVSAWQIQIADTSGCRFPEGEALTPAEYAAVARFIADQRRLRSLKDLPVAGSHDIGYFSETLADYGTEPQERFRGCPGGLSSVGITSSGGVKACLSLPDELIEGNIRTRTLASIWRDPSSFPRNRRFCLVELEPPCDGCDQGELCRAGCWAMALSSTGSAYGNQHCLRAIERSTMGRG
jgi:radical SAM protein with 4Fe4S-binding SPASM domain